MSSLNATAEVRAIDVSALPNLVTGSRGTLWWGMVFLIVIEAAVFGALISSYFYLRLGHPQWPPAGVKPPDLLLPTLNTLILLASSVAIHWGDRGIDRGDQQALKWWMTTGIGLGVLFVVLKVVEYAGVEYSPQDHAYASIVWTVVGYHTAHVIALILKTLVLAVLAWRGYFTRERRLGVQINGMYWHFVVGVWLPLYAMLYFAPRVL